MQPLPPNFFVFKENELSQCAPKGFVFHCVDAVGGGYFLSFLFFKKKFQTKMKTRRRGNNVLLFTGELLLSSQTWTAVNLWRRVDRASIMACVTDATIATADILVAAVAALLITVRPKNGHHQVSSSSRPALQPLHFQTFEPIEKKKFTDQISLTRCFTSEWIQTNLHF